MPTCNEIVITQGLLKGCLGGPYQKEDLSISDGIIANIVQVGKRTISIRSDKEIDCDDLFCQFQTLEKLLMLFDGRFYPIESLKFEESKHDKPEILREYAEKVQKDRLPYYETRDLFQCSCLRLISFQDVLNSEIYKKWRNLLDEMDIAYQVFLYSLSKSGNPVDVCFSFLAELAEPFVELLKEKPDYCETLNPGERGTTLKKCIDSIIKHFGDSIFQKELNGEDKSFLDRVVGSRVRVMHIKKKQKDFFDGKECIRYSWKFSLLYRIILFRLLEISEDQYKNYLTKVVEKIDAW